MISEELLLAWGGTYKFLEPDEILFMEGAVCTYYFQVVKGELRWVNVNDEGKEYLQTITTEGQCIGELPLFDDEVYAATAISNAKSTVIKLPKKIFHQLLREYPDIHFGFSKLLTTRLRFKFFLLKEMAYNDPEKLIVSLLNYFKKNKLYMDPKNDQVQLTRQQIADFTGLRVETVIRVIRNLNEKGKLSIEKGKVFFKDMIPVT